MANHVPEGSAPIRSLGQLEPATRVSVFLYPGQVVVAHEAAAVTTILGSCVAVCLWDPERRMGGVNHFLLPHFVAGNDVSSSRFGNVAIGRLVAGVIAPGVRRQALQAKVFGGACVIDAFRGRGDGRHLGLQNVEVALMLLRRERIPVVAEDVGGRRGRKVIFHTDTGAALVKLI